MKNKINILLEKYRYDLTEEDYLSLKELIKLYNFTEEELMYEIQDLLKNNNYIE